MEIRFDLIKEHTDIKSDVVTKKVTVSVDEEFDTSEHEKSEIQFEVVSSPDKNLSYTNEGGDCIISWNNPNEGDEIEVTVSAEHPGLPELPTISENFNWKIQKIEEVAEKWFKLHLPDYTDGSGEAKGSYLRMGAPVKDIQGKKIEDFIYEGAENTTSGWLEYTDGDRFVETKNNSFSMTHGEALHRYKNDYMEYKNADSYEFNSWFNFEVGIGTKFESFIGLITEIFLGGKFEANFTPIPSVSVNAGFEANYFLGVKYEASVDDVVEVSKTFEQEAENKIELKVDPWASDTSTEKFLENVVPIGLPILTGVTAVTPSVLSSAFSWTSRYASQDQEEDKSWQDVAKAMAWTSQGISGAMWVLGFITSTWDYLRRKTKPDNPSSKLLMDKEKVEIKVGDSAILLTGEEIILKSSKIVLMQAGSATATLDDDAFTVCFRDINVKGAEISAPDGAVSAKKLAASDGIIGEMADLGKPHVVNPVNEPSYLKRLRREMKKRRHDMLGGIDE